MSGVRRCACRHAGPACQHLIAPLLTHMLYAGSRHSWSAVADMRTPWFPSTCSISQRTAGMLQPARVRSQINCMCSFLGYPQHVLDRTAGADAQNSQKKQKRCRCWYRILTSNTSVEGWCTVTATVRPVSLMLRTARMTIAAARASRPALAAGALAASGWQESQPCLVIGEHSQLRGLLKARRPHSNTPEILIQSSAYGR